MNMNEQIMYDGYDIELLLFKSLRGPLLAGIKNMEEARDYLRHIRRDLIRTRDCTSAFVMVARVQLRVDEAKCVRVLANNKEEVGVLASACLRWDARYGRFVNINPWEDGVMKGYRRERYAHLLRGHGSIMESAEGRLLKLEFGEDREW